MPTLTMTIKTPLGPGFFDPAEISVREGVSELFHIQLDVLVDNAKNVPFEKLLGEKISVEYEVSAGKKRHFSGICQRVSQGANNRVKTRYRIDVVPQLWLLTKRAQSRLFQHLTVPEILKKVFEGLDVAWDLTVQYPPRDYCAQYRESDFAFACRLMEEEGIFYYFKHTADSHKLVVADSPRGWTDLDPAKIFYESVEGGTRDEMRIYGWERSQELRSGKFTLWDQNFELTGGTGTFNHLESEKIVPDSVQVGQVTHKLKVANNDKLEVYDYPGFYADHFDGINKGGGEQAADLQKIFTENRRYVELRMQQENAPAVVIRGASNTGALTPGYKFTLANVPTDATGKFIKAEGGYVITAVLHNARFPEEGQQFQYANTFTCVPQAAAFRPPRVTPKPVIQGTQTAVVVGPKGEEIFTDKYGRVKVQFHWDRAGKYDGDSSCWVRVGTPWAGKQWGMIHIPRVGQEVIVAFQEGDPDQPIIVGSVYNAEQMPPFKLPDNKTQSGLRTRSSLKGGADNCNELRFEDKKGSEDIFFHAEKDFHREVENDDELKVGRDQKENIKNSRSTIVEDADDKLQLKKGHRSALIEMGNDGLQIKMGNRTEKLDLGKSTTEAMQSIEFKVGQSSIVINQMGITLKGMTIKVEGTVQTQVKGLMCQVSGDAMLTLKGGLTMVN